MSGMSSYQTAVGGLVMLSARPHLTLDEFCARIGDKLVLLRAALGRDVAARIGVRVEQDPLAEMQGERAMEPADAILDLAMPGDNDPSRLAARLGALHELDDCIDPGSSALAVGTLCYIHRQLPEGREILAFVGRKAPAATVMEMRHWWLEQHAPLINKLQNGIARPWSYAQLHVDHDASDMAAARSGFAAVCYDMGDLVAIADRAAFLEFHTLPEVARALEEDEKGFLDQSSWRGALVSQI